MINWNMNCMKERERGLTEHGAEQVDLAGGRDGAGAPEDGAASPEQPLQRRRLRLHPPAPPAPADGATATRLLFTGGAASTPPLLSSSTTPPPSRPPPPLDPLPTFIKDPTKNNSNKKQEAARIKKQCVEEERCKKQRGRERYTGARNREGRN